MRGRAAPRTRTAASRPTPARAGMGGCRTRRLSNPADRPWWSPSARSTPTRSSPSTGPASTRGTPPSRPPPPAGAVRRGRTARAPLRRRRRDGARPRLGRRRQGLRAERVRRRRLLDRHGDLPVRPAAPFVADPVRPQGRPHALGEVDARTGRTRVDAPAPGAERPRCTRSPAPAPAPPQTGPGPPGMRRPRASGRAPGDPAGAAAPAAPASRRPEGGPGTSRPGPAARGAVLTGSPGPVPA